VEKDLEKTKESVLWKEDRGRIEWEWKGKVKAIGRGGGLCKSTVMGIATLKSRAAILKALKKTMKALVLKRQRFWHSKALAKAKNKN
jgi:hypothetical protein